MRNEPDGLFTDLYEFTMAQSYLDHGKQDASVFDLHARSLPTDRGYLVASGTSTLVDRLEGYTFAEDTLAFLEAQGLSAQLLDYLEAFRFDGEVRCVPEGRIVYPYEPLVHVEAPLPMAQLVETLVLNTVHVETVLASKAARFYEAIGAPEDPDDAAAMVDFGARRAHGPDAAWAAARAAFIAGMAGTSLVSAAQQLGIPCFGTMAHSYVEAFQDEQEALEAFARSHPDGTTLLIDTYDTINGARMVVDLADGLMEEGIQIGGVRIDSGDLGAQAKRVRQILDEAGLEDVDIFLSGGLDEHAIREHLAEEVPVDGFGIGTSLVTSQDAPALDISYKLVAYNGEPVVKMSPGKHTLPGAKQVYRRIEEDTMQEDIIAQRDERVDGEALLEPAGSVDPVQDTQAARNRFLEEIHHVPRAVRRLQAPDAYPVYRSPGLDAWLDQAIQRAGHEPEPAKRPLAAWND